RGDTSGNGQGSQVIAEHASLGRYILACDETPDLLFTENETNVQRLYGAPNPSPYVKDGVNDAIVYGQGEAVNPDGVGTKAAAHYHGAGLAGRLARSLARLVRPRCGSARRPAPNAPARAGSARSGSETRPRRRGAARPPGANRRRTVAWRLE